MFNPRLEFVADFAVFIVIKPKRPINRKTYTIIVIPYFANPILDQWYILQQFQSQGMC